jgi:hypothetical protein
MLGILCKLNLRSQYKYVVLSGHRLESWEKTNRSITLESAEDRLFDDAVSPMQTRVFLQENEAMVS